MATTPTEHPSTTSTFPTRQKPIPYSCDNGRRTQLSSILPPLVFGTATFNNQYNNDPFALDTTGLVTSALTHGIRAFDTSPYYGPSEQLLGDALATPFVRETFPRDSYMILTKVGRVASSEFDYSKEWVRHSVSRSLERLHTNYVDLVYCHDVEFVSPAEVLEAVKELRRIRDEEGTVRYIGISGYPIHVLGDMAELILRETGEPLDAVQSYANFTLQNQTLAGPQGIEAPYGNAGVDVVPQRFPSSEWVSYAALDLRAAIRRASDFCDAYGERIEVMAIRFALESWIICRYIGWDREATPASGVPWKHESINDVGGSKLGVSVIGVSRAEELEKTMLVWRSILDGLEGGEATAVQAGRWYRAWEWSRNRRKAVQILADGVREELGIWFDYAWDSPGEGFVNQRKRDTRIPNNGAAPWLTPAASPASVPSKGTADITEEKILPLR
ncbi:hypothetical protein SNOG_08439 [Parastagonospora nodorum SN15]|uniref:NADP-dependent oxidoreductase domain-containing protein n=1 Tax=Phaeosphaeria nodorum (strain SN15 / ATCC MYA-4574 / FGSC 10173) TaxID=321614 RepID=Q0UIH5_PHANO|nr:hypothetical protein SNOG_08439 [Parastagonospora nodorum SN15]EAT84715.2 hypothetical protein SNOG_08439 [Parastagonospora nodorum SN15]